MGRRDAGIAHAARYGQPTDRKRSELANCCTIQTVTNRSQSPHVKVLFHRTVLP